MTKAREIVRAKVVSVSLTKIAKGYRSLFLKHLIRHFVTPSPAGEGKNARKFERTRMDSEGLYARLRTVETPVPTIYPRFCGDKGGFRGWVCLLRPSIRHPELVEGSHRSAKVTFFEKRFFDSAVATLRMTKARENARAKVVSVV